MIIFMKLNNFLQILLKKLNPIDDNAQLTFILKFFLVHHQIFKNLQNYIFYK